MSGEYDPFKGYEGGFGDDEDLTFTNVRFAVDPEFTNDDGEMLPALFADLVGEEDTFEGQRFSIGKGWEIEDSGAKVVREDGKEKGFQNQTYLQKFLNAAFECDGGEELLRGRWQETGLTPQDAAYWEGLKVHTEQVELYNFKNREGEQVSVTKPLPTVVYGWDEGGTGAKKKAAAKKAPAKKVAAKKTAAKKPAAKPAPKAKEQSEYEAAMEAVGSEVVEALREIAAEAEDANAFFDAAYAQDWVAEDEAVQLLVDDYESDESIWMVEYNSREEA